MATWNPFRRNGLGAQAYTECVDFRFRGNRSVYLDERLWGCGKANTWRQYKMEPIREKVLKLAHASTLHMTLRLPGGDLRTLMVKLSYQLE